MHQPEGRGIAAALVVVVIWAASFSFAKQAIEHLGPWMFRFYSVTLGLLPMLGWVASSVAGLRQLDRRSRRQVMGAVFINGSLVATANMVALAWFPASTVLTLMYTMQAFTSVIDALQRRRWSAVGMAAPLAAGAGVLLFTWGGGAEIGTGVLLVLMNALAWAIGTWLSGRPTQRLPAQSMMTLQMVVAFASTLPMAGWVLLQPGPLPSPTQMDLLGIGWAGLLNGSVVFWLWYYAIQQLGAVRAAWFTLLVPVLGSVIAVVYFAETLVRWQMAGIALVSFGIALQAIAQRAASSPPPAHR